MELSGVDLDARLAALVPDGPARDELLLVAQRMRALRQEAAAENRRCQRIVDGLAAELPDECHRVRAPRLDEEVRDLPGLAQLADLLLAGEQR